MARKHCKRETSKCRWRREASTKASLMMDSSVLDTSREPLRLPQFEKAVMQSVTRALEVWRDEAMEGGLASFALTALTRAFLFPAKPVGQLIRGALCSTITAFSPWLDRIKMQDTRQESRLSGLILFHPCSGKDNCEHGAELCDGSFLPTQSSRALQGHDASTADCQAPW